jgi:hydroxymethylbilane synthase
LVDLKTIRIGSRTSELAIAQCKWVKDKIEANGHGTQVEIVPMITQGDIKLGEPLMKIGGKGLFTEELETALRNGEIDIAVHSLKDMPQDIKEDIPIIALSTRDDPRDAIVFSRCPREGSRDSGARLLGTSSLRRMLQARLLFGESIKLSPVRGNVVTRLSKLDSGEYGSLILAASGLVRLGLRDRISQLLDTDDMIPAAGQGVLAVQGRRSDDNSIVIDAIHDRDSWYEYTAESSFIREIGASCTSPVGVFAIARGTELTVKAIIADYRENAASCCGDNNSCVDQYIFENVKTGRIVIDVKEAEKAGEMLLKSMT